jgi:hypothetical protein
VHETVCPDIGRYWETVEEGTSPADVQTRLRDLRRMKR